MRRSRMASPQYPLLLTAATVFLLVFQTNALDLDLARKHEGCFPSFPGDGEKPAEMSANLDTEECLQACTEKHFMYASTKSDGRCLCGPTLSGEPLSSNMCGGDDVFVVYKTEVSVPGPPDDLALVSKGETSLSLSWRKPRGFSSEDILDYHVRAEFLWSFDKRKRAVLPKVLQVSGLSTRIFGLLPGSKYNVSVTAASEKGHGVISSQIFWTEVGQPLSPPAPQLIQHGHGHDGEIHLKLSPLSNNPSGPVSSYRVVVMNESDRSPFDPESTGVWREGAAHWVAAEIDPAWFRLHDEFVVGDGRRYGEYLNYGPLDTDKYDFHVTVGAVSTLNGTTKVSYATVSHDQHAMENIIVFRFHDHGKDSHHHGDGGDHFHPLVHYDRVGKRDKDKEHRHRNDHDDHHDESESDPLTIVLAVAVALFGVLLGAALAFYVYLRFFHERLRKMRRRGGAGGIGIGEANGWRQQEAQELTLHQTLPPQDVESQGSSDRDSRQPSPALDSLRERVWQIPRNFLQLSGEVVGRGSFGSVIRGTVNLRGRRRAAIVQVAAAAAEQPSSAAADLAKSISLVADCSDHPNVLGLIGLCGLGEDSSTLYVVLEDGSVSLKQALLDARIAQHDPDRARRTGSGSAIKEEQLLGYARGIAAALEYLSSKQIIHRKVCARNVSLHPLPGDPPEGEEEANHSPSASDLPVAKLGGFGIVDFSRGQPGSEADHVRWHSHERLYGREANTKSDVWAFGVLMWEIFTLGATPYSDVPSSEVASQVCRGLRLPNASPQFSDSLHALMLDCWQIDADERPSFAEVAANLDHLMDEARQHKMPLLDHTLTPGYDYLPFAQELEMRRFQ